MKKFYQKLLYLIFLLWPSFSLADDYGLSATAKTAGYKNPQPLPTAIGNIVGLFLSFLGVIFFALIVYGGFLWMTAAGSENKVGTAKKIIVSAVTGLAIVLSAYAITYFITNQLQKAV